MICKKIIAFFRKRRSDLAEEKVTIIGKRGIKRILPHRGRMLLLDEVSISSTKIIGKFRVTRKVCKGHAVLGGELVLRGCELFDMSAQLLGVWASHLLKIKKDALVRSYGEGAYGGAKFRKPIYSREILNLEINTNNISSEILRGGRVIVIRGRSFSAQVNGEARAEVKSVELVVPKA